MSPSPKTIRVEQHTVVISIVNVSSTVTWLTILGPSVPNLLLGSVLMPYRTIMSVNQLDFSVDAHFCSDFHVSL